MQLRRTIYIVPDGFRSAVSVEIYVSEAPFLFGIWVEPINRVILSPAAFGELQAFANDQGKERKFFSSLPRYERARLPVGL